MDYLLRPKYICLNRWSIYRYTIKNDVHHICMCMAKKYNNDNDKLVELMMIAVAHDYNIMTTKIMTMGRALDIIMIMIMIIATATTMLKLKKHRVDRHKRTTNTEKSGQKAIRRPQAES